MKNQGEKTMDKLVKVVVLDDNKVVTSSIRKYFLSSANIEIVEVFSNGKPGLDYLINNSSSYDMIVLDIILPSIDGIRILEELNNHHIYKKVIILSSYKDDYTIQRVKDLGASFFMLKPFSLESLEKRIVDISSSAPIKIKMMGDSVELEVSSILHELGIPSHLRGYQYIRDGVMLMYENEANNTLVTKDVYPEIATRYDTTSSRVERAIRHAIEISWIRGDLRLMEDLFGNSIDFERSKPTNAELLSTIADRLKINKRIFLR